MSRRGRSIPVISPRCERQSSSAHIARLQCLSGCPSLPLSILENNLVSVILAISQVDIVKYSSQTPWIMVSPSITIAKSQDRAFHNEDVLGKQSEAMGWTLYADRSMVGQAVGAAAVLLNSRNETASRRATLCSDEANIF